MEKAVKPQPTEETDYLVTANAIPAGKPDTDLEIAAPILTDPKMHELRAARKKCGWKHGQNRTRKDNGN
jgi:hypothetical protein